MRGRLDLSALGPPHRGDTGLWPSAGAADHEPGGTIGSGMCITASQ